MYYSVFSKLWNINHAIINRASLVRGFMLCSLSFLVENMTTKGIRGYEIFIVVRGLESLEGASASFIAKTLI